MSLQIDFPGLASEGPDAPASDWSDPVPCPCCAEEDEGGRNFSDARGPVAPPRVLTLRTV